MAETTILMLVTIFVFLHILKELKLINKKLTSLSLLGVRAFLTVRGVKVENMDMKVTQKLPIALKLEDRFDNELPAPATPPVWSVQDANLGSIVAAADGMSAEFTPSGRVGATQISAMISVGEQTLQGILDLNLIPGDVEEVLLTPGTPVNV